MRINFYPEQDNIQFEKSVKEYKAIWEEQGIKITEAIERVSGLKFREKIINAIIYNGISYSSPLRLQSNILIGHKKGTLIHELCHRLVVGNNIVIETGKTDKSWTINIHKHIYLILYDIWVELYGEKFGKKEIDYEIDLWPEKEMSPYKIAWDWALSIDIERRQKLWKKILKNNRGNLLDFEAKV